MNFFAYYAKKALGIATYADDMARLHTISTATPGIVAAVTKVVAAPFVATGNIVSTVSTTVATVTATAVGGGVAGFGGKFIATSVIIPTVAVVAGATSIEVARTAVLRSNQIRAVAADTVRRPVDIDRALNPAYHNERAALAAGEREKLVARYMSSRNIDDSTPLIGYTSKIGGPKVTGATSTKSGVDDDDAQVITTSEISLIEEEDEEAARARLYAIEKEQETFTQTVGGSSSQTITTQVTQTFTDPGLHGIEFEFSVIKTRSVVTASIVVGHGTIIDILGEEEYVETFKAEAAQVAGVGYVVSLIRGTTNLGPGSYLNSQSGSDIANIATNVLAEHFSRSDSNSPNPGGVQLDPKSFAISTSAGSGPTSYQVTSTNTRTRQVFSPMSVLDQLRSALSPSGGGTRVKVTSSSRVVGRNSAPQTRTRSRQVSRTRYRRRSAGMGGIPQGSLYQGDTPVSTPLQ